MHQGTIESKLRSLWKQCSHYHKRTYPHVPLYASLYYIPSTYIPLHKDSPIYILGWMIYVLTWPPSSICLQVSFTGLIFPALVVVVFPQSQCHCENVPGRTGIIHLRNCTLGIYHCDLIPWWLGHELVWSFCSLLNFQVHPLGMPLQVLESLSRT